MKIERNIKKYLSPNYLNQLSKYTIMQNNYNVFEYIFIKNGEPCFEKKIIEINLTLDLAARRCNEEHLKTGKAIYFNEQSTQV